jgi:hypothetical protein
MRKIALLLVVSSITILSAPNSLSKPGEGRTSFHAETPPLPVTTTTGKWSGGGDAVRLRVDGLHLVGDHTSFVGRWTTPWSWPRKYPHLEGEAFFTMVAGEERSFTIGVLVRRQIRGRPWSKWEGSRDDILVREGPDSLEATVAEGVYLERPRRVRFDIKFLGRMEDVSAITGYIDLMLRDPR